MTTVLEKVKRLERYVAADENAVDQGMNKHSINCLNARRRASKMSSTS